MTTTDGLAILTWLEAQIAQDEELARRWPHDEHEWQLVGRRHLTYQSGSGEDVAAIDVSNQSCLWWERIYVKMDLDGLAAHIATWDPARVLAECTLKRALLAPHVPRGVQGPPPYRWTCRFCDDAPVAWQAYLSWPCAPVRQMTAVYTDREGYDLAWNPSGGAS